MPQQRVLVSAFFLSSLVAGFLMGTGWREMEAGWRAPRARPPSPGPRLEAGLGRLAETPADIPSRGWWDILLRTYERVTENRVLTLAAAMVFYGLLAVFPAVTAVVSIYGLFASPSTVADHLMTLSQFLPPDSFQIVAGQIERVVAKNNGGLTSAFVAGLAVAIWSTNSATRALIDALNVAYGEEEKRSFLVLNAVSLAFTVGAIVMVLVAIGAVVVFPLVLERIGFAGYTGQALSLLRWPTFAVVLVFMLAVLYRFGPSRRDAAWKWVSVGSVLATMVWIVASLGLSFYLSHFADYNATYGSLGAAIGLMIWMWLSNILVLLGAELNAEMEHQTARDTTTSGERPMGERGARMADTLGGAR
jgi:membrane protein